MAIMFSSIALTLSALAFFFSFFGVRSLAIRLRDLEQSQITKGDLQEFGDDIKRAINPNLPKLKDAPQPPKDRKR